MAGVLLHARELLLDVRKRRIANRRKK